MLSRKPNRKTDSMTEINIIITGGILTAEHCSELITAINKELEAACEVKISDDKESQKHPLDD